MSAKGYIGLAPQETAQEMIICVLEGGAVPYVLWPTPDVHDGSPCYQFIGEAYVHGLMDGEAIQNLREVDGARQEICLV